MRQTGCQAERAAWGQALRAGSLCRDWSVRQTGYRAERAALGSGPASGLALQGQSCCRANGSEGGGRQASVVFGARRVVTRVCGLLA